MSIFLYVPKDTVVHRLHPVTKLVCLVLGFVFALTFSHPVAAAIVLGVSLAVLAAARALKESLRRTWKFLIVLLVVTTLIWSLFLKLGEKVKHEEAEIPWKLGVPIPWDRDAEGEPKRLELIEASPRSVAYGAAMGLRLTACIIFGLTLLASTRTEDFALALRLIGFPSSVSLAVSLAFRLVPTLAATGRNVVNAQRARGVDPSRENMARRILAYIPLVTPVLAYALRGADALAMALESRGLGATSQTRTHYRTFEFKARDVVVLLVAMAIVAGSIVLRKMGFGAITLG